MEYRVTNNGLGVSLLGMGTMRMPCHLPVKKEANPLIDYKRAAEMVDYAYSHGVTYFDTAYMYHAGKSESFIGKALSKYPRDSFFLADKLPVWMCASKAGVARVFETQKRRCGVSYFDYYLLHSLNGENFDKSEKLGAYEFMVEKQAAGEIGKIGFSFHGSIDDLKRIVAAHHWDFAQIQLNYLDWKDQRAEEQYNILTDAGIAVIIMEPVRGGKLAAPGEKAEKLFKAADSESSVASWALRYAASLPNVLTVLSGMSTLEQVEDNINTVSPFRALDEKERAVVENAASIIREIDVVPCTGCDYCADCPQSVKISSIFRIYNKFVSGETESEAAKKMYKALDVTASECVSCGKCKGHCPQSIEIPELLHGKVGNFFSE